MTNQEFEKFFEKIRDMAICTSFEAYQSLCEDAEALQMAFESGNNTLVFAMASYIASIRGLSNGTQVAQAITSKIFNMN